MFELDLPHLQSHVLIEVHACSPSFRERAARCRGDEAISEQSIVHVLDDAARIEIGLWIRQQPGLHRAEVLVECRTRSLARLAVPVPHARLRRPRQARGSPTLETASTMGQVRVSSLHDVPNLDASSTEFRVCASWLWSKASTPRSSKNASATAPSLSPSAFTATSAPPSTTRQQS